MKIAEELYQAGFISYPRTETDGFSQDYDLMVRGAMITVHQLSLSSFSSAMSVDPDSTTSIRVRWLLDTYRRQRCTMIWGVGAFSPVLGTALAQRIHVLPTSCASPVLIRRCMLGRACVGSTVATSGGAHTLGSWWTAPCSASQATGATMTRRIPPSTQRATPPARAAGPRKRSACMSSSSAISWRALPPSSHPGICLLCAC